MQGYAYLLTHPGTPSVFYDHIFSHYKSEIAALISLRKRNKVNCRSVVSIVNFSKKFERKIKEIDYLNFIFLTLSPSSGCFFLSFSHLLDR